MLAVAVTVPGGSTLILRPWLQGPRPSLELSKRPDGAHSPPSHAAGSGSMGAVRPGLGVAAGAPAALRAV